MIKVNLISPEQIENFDTLLLMHDQALNLIGQYEHFGIAVPEYLTEYRCTVSREIVRRNRVRVRRELKKAEVMFDALKTPSEKRKDLEQTIKDLKSQL
jgi:hypothetical protein